MPTSFHPRPVGETVLVFPATMARARQFIDQARERGDRVVGASSLAHDTPVSGCDAWGLLPFIDSPDFEDHLASLVADQGISLIYTPHLVVWRRLDEAIRGGRIATRLVRNRPWHEDLAPWLGALADAERLAAEASPFPAAPTAAPLSGVATASILFRTEAIPGWCSREKMESFIQVFRHLPRGDVVEIGVWCGKSASLLAGLARAHAIGPVLCVDPWNLTAATQESAAINTVFAEFDFAQVLTVFKLALLSGEASGHVNYLRATSREAALRYREDPCIHSEEFGTTRYDGIIALLHIDGNHDQDQVTTDLELWAPQVSAGGWIVLDDYTHAFGDGPRIAADRFLTNHRERIDVAFVSGTALFLQITSRL